MADLVVLPPQSISHADFSRYNNLDQVFYPIHIPFPERKTHFIEWFSGQDIDTIWTKADVAGTNTFQMVDEINEGFEIITGSTAENRASIWFNGIKHYKEQGSKSIFTIRRVTSTEIGLVVGLSSIADVGGSGNDRAVTFNQQTGFFQFNTHTGSTSTLVNSSIALDEVFHHFELEVTPSTGTMTMEGVLEATSTTTLPNDPVAPSFFVRNYTGGSTRTGRIRYFEAYNT